MKTHDFEDDSLKVLVVSLFTLRVGLMIVLPAPLLALVYALATGDFTVHVGFLFGLTLWLSIGFLQDRANPTSWRDYPRSMGRAFIWPWVVFQYPAQSRFNVLDMALFATALLPLALIWIITACMPVPDVIPDDVSAITGLYMMMGNTVICAYALTQIATLAIRGPTLPAMLSMAHRLAWYTSLLLLSHTVMLSQSPTVQTVLTQIRADPGLSVTWLATALLLALVFNMAPRYRVAESHGVMMHKSLSNVDEQSTLKEKT